MTKQKQVRKKIGFQIFGAYFGGPSIVCKGPSIASTSGETLQMVFFFKGETFGQLANLFAGPFEDPYQTHCRAKAEQGLDKFYKELLSLFVSHTWGGSSRSYFTQAGQMQQTLI